MFEREQATEVDVASVSIEPTARHEVARPPLTHTDDRSVASEVLKVSTRSRPSAVAGAIAGVMRLHPSVEVQSIGAGATNQAIKAVAIATSYLHDDGIAICCVPFFIDVAIDGEDRTALRLVVQRYPTETSVPSRSREAEQKGTQAHGPA